MLRPYKLLIATHSRAVLLSAFTMGALYSKGVCAQNADDGAGSTDSAALSAAVKLSSYSCLESRALNALLSSSSRPVGIFGELRLQLRKHSITEFADTTYMFRDRSWTQTNWNDPFASITIVAKPGHYGVVWSKFHIYNRFIGYYLGESKIDTIALGYETAQGHSSDKPIVLEDNFTVGTSLAFGQLITSLRIGGGQYIESSPFTVWRGATRDLPWEYRNERERTIGSHYNDVIVTGDQVKLDDWNKQSFFGLHLESTYLPRNLFTRFFFGEMPAFGQAERDYTEWWGNNKSYGRIFHARVTDGLLLGQLTPGVNVLKVFYEPDVIFDLAYLRKFNPAFLFPKITVTDGSLLTDVPSFYREPFVASLDLKGTLGKYLDIQSEMALSRSDSTHITYDVQFAQNTLSAIVDTTYFNYRERVTSTGFSPAFYARLVSSLGFLAQLDIAYLSEKFLSPYSFVAPQSGFFPVSATRVGVTRVLGGADGSVYGPNMTGALLSINPRIRNGHIKIGYGQHVQLAKAADLLTFPLRLHTYEFVRCFTTSTSKYGANNLFDNSLAEYYQKRLGDESYSFSTELSGSRIFGPQSGGLRGDMNGLYDAFVAYENEAQADSNLAEKTDVFTPSRFVPQHRKWSFHSDIDAGYDFSKLTTLRTPLLCQLYGSMSGISTTFKPIAFNHKDIMLWGAMVRAEPAIGLRRNLFLTGVWGFETWRSRMAFMDNKPISKFRASRGGNRRSTDVYNVDLAQPRSSHRVELDYRDFMYGAGLDWQPFPRVSAHVRISKLTHTDVHYRGNNWTTPVASFSSRVWF